MSNKFILILVDQMRYDCLEYLNKQNIFTPHLNDLSLDSETYVNTYSPSPSCVPARACIATGNYPYKNEKVGYIDKTEWNYNTFMQTLANNKVKTINVGKTHFYPQSDGLGFTVNKIYDPQDFKDGFESDYNKFLQENNMPLSVDSANTNNNNTYLYYGFDYPEHFHPTNWTADTAIDELKKIDRSEDFFMQISFHRPHPPYDPVDKYFKMYDDIQFDYFSNDNWSEDFEPNYYSTQTAKGKIPKKYNDLLIKAYFASITQIDYNIGKIIYYLKANNLYNDTKIIFTSDHGEMLGEHNMFRKIVPFNGSAKVPFIFKNNYIRNSINSRVCSLIDLYPTILNNFEIECNVDGEIINSSSFKNRKFIYGEHTDYDSGWFFVCDDKYKLIWDSKQGKKYIFDVVNDENELNNLDIVLPDHEQFLKNKLSEQYGEHLVKDNQFVVGNVVNVFGKPIKND